MTDSTRPDPVSEAPAPHAGPELARRLGLWALVGYGLGTIVGAGIYALVGKVAGAAGFAAPLAFLLAGGVAALTGISYAELVARHPEAAGEAAYVREGLSSRWLSGLVGTSLILAALIAGASIARSTAGYLGHYVDLPLWVGGALVVGLFTVVGCFGVRQSVGVAVTLTVIEILGLLLILALGVPGLAELPERIVNEGTVTATGLAGVALGGFIAFFAYIGFDTLANMAEETRDVGRTLPRAILLAILFSTLLYAGVSLVAVMAVPVPELAESDRPLLLVLSRMGHEFADYFGLIALIATANGVLIEIVLAGRLAYGLSRRRLLPNWFSGVNPLTRTPLRATAVGGGIMLALVVSFDLEDLVEATSSLVLAVFTLVNLALWRLHRIQPRDDLHVRAPAWLPPVAAITCILMTLAPYWD